MTSALEAAVGSLDLAPDVRTRLARYLALLLEHNAAVNLTGARDAEAVLEHVRDSLTIAPHIREPLIDVGSGGGFPGIPLAIVLGIPVTLVEATNKKAQFLEMVARELDLHLTVVADRAETAAHDPELRERFGSATARGIASAPAVMELTLPFLAIGGVAVLQRGQVDYAERTAAQDAALALGGGLLDEHGQGNRRVLIVAKRRTTPAAFPRRAGVPERRPLGWPRGTLNGNGASPAPADA
jgi:16S rRNA (guanine527-N7)-methyltransferase